MKKIINILIAVSLTLSVVMFPAAAYVDTEGNFYEADIDELTVLGIVSGYNGEEFLPDKLVTRAEFVKMAAGVYCMEFSAEKSYYSDVTSEHFAFNEISYITSRGIVTGYGDGTFRPDDSVSFGEAVKIMVLMLGYDYRISGDKNSIALCMYEAKLMGLLNGLDIAYTDKLSRGAACRLINNALDIPLPVATGVKGDNYIYEISADKNLLSEYLKLRRDEGIVSSNEFSSIKGVPVAPENQIIINGIYFKSDSVAVSELLGQNVKFIYRIDDDSDVKELIFIQPVNNSVTCVRSRYYRGFENNIFKYTDDAENEKEIRISPEADIVINGSPAKFSPDMFDIGYGEIRFIKADGSSLCETVFIDKYEQYVVGSINNTTNVIIDYLDGSKKLDLSGDNKKIIIFGTDGKESSFANIKAKNLLSVVEGADYKKVYISGNIFSGIIESFVDDKVFVGENEYIVNPYSNTGKLDFGTVYNFYTDIFGNIGYFEKGTVNSNDYAFIIKFVPKNEAGEENILAKVYIPGKGIGGYKLASNLEINGESAKNADIEELTERLSGDVTQLVVMKFNDKEEIREITTATPIRELEKRGEDGFCLLSERSSYIVTNEDSKNLSLQFEIYLNSDTPILYVPNDSDMEKAVESDFIVGKISGFSSLSSYSFQAYSMSKDADIADILVYIRPSIGGGGGTPAAKAVMATVSRIVSAVDSDGVAAKKIYLMRAGQEISYFLSDDDSIAYKNGDYVCKLSELSPGDVITLAYNSKGVMNGFRMIYDYDQQRYFALGGESSFGSSNRTLKRTIKKIGTDIISLYNPLNETVAISRLRKPTGNITVVRETGAGTFVKAGTVNDIDLEDEIMIQYISRVVKEIVVFKK